MESLRYSLTWLVLCSLVGLFYFAIAVCSRFSLSQANTFELEGHYLKEKVEVREWKDDGWSFGSPFAYFRHFSFDDAELNSVLRSERIELDLKIAVTHRAARLDEAKAIYVEEISTMLMSQERDWSSPRFTERLSPFDLRGVLTDEVCDALEAFLGARNSTEVTEQKLQEVALEAVRPIADRYPFLEFGFEFSNLRIDGHFVRN